MSSLAELAAVDGVVVAFEFTPEGKLAEYKSGAGVPAEQAGMAAQFCAAVTMNFNVLAGAFTKLSGMSWVPQQGWAYSGGEYTVAIGGDGYKGVFIKTAKADFNKLFQMLVGSH